jgi:FkbM family methyltransferase
VGILRTLRRRLIDRPFWIDHEPWLKQVHGVIHVGANIGQERDLYRRRDLRVLWVEPIPEVFATLQRHIAGLADQRAVQALITEHAGEAHELHVASNQGGSSSILPMKRHAELWPEVRYERTIRLRSDSLPSLLERLQLRPQDYDFLALDTQGSELQVLRGAVPLLPHFRFVKVEVADFEAYAGGCLLADVERFFAEHGFVEHARHCFASRPGVGSMYDIVYRRAADPG